MKEIKQLLETLASQRKLVDRLKADAETTALVVTEHETRLARTKQAIKISSGVIIASKTRLNDLESMRKNAREERARHVFAMELFKYRQPPQAYLDYRAIVEAMAIASTNDRQYLAMEAQDKRLNPEVAEWLESIAANEQRKNGLIACDKAIKAYDDGIVQARLTIRQEINKQHKGHKLVTALTQMITTDTKTAKICRANWIDANKVLVKLESESQVAKNALQSDQTSLELFLKAQANKNRARQGHANKKRQKAASEKARRETCTVWIKTPVNPLNMDSIEKTARVPYQKLGEIPTTKSEKAKTPRGAKLKRFI